MDLGLIFVGAGMTVSDMADISAKAERNGLSTVAIAEAWRSGWVPLTAMAAATKTIRLAPYVLNAYGRSPMLTGMSAIDFNDFSGGRLKLGIGGGNKFINEQWQGIAHERVLTKMREYVTLLKLMARTRIGEQLQFEGKIHRMDWTPAVDPDEQPYPVYLAAVFPRMLKVAAQVADGIGGGATLSVDYLNNVVKPMAREFAADADRDPAELKWNAVGVLAMDDDRDKARRAAREAICHFYAPLPHPYYEFTMREQGFGNAADQLLKLMPAGRLEAAIDAIPDDCIDRLTIAGTPAECRAQLRSYDRVLDEMLLLNVMPIDPANPAASFAPLMALARR